MTILSGLLAERRPSHEPQAVPTRERILEQVGWVRAVARNLVRDPWRAEDLTQETLLAALTAPPRDAADDRQLRAWLARVAFNLSRLSSRQLVRSRAREQRVARPEATPSVTDGLESAATLRELAEALAGLPEPYQSVVRQRYFEGLSTAEIATRCGASELAVRKRLWRARGKLREAMEPESPFLVVLAGWLPRAKSLANLRHWKAIAGVAAGLAVGGAALTLALGVEREAPRVSALTSEPASKRVELAPWSDGSSPTNPFVPRDGPRSSARRPTASGEQNSVPEVREPRARSEVVLRGVALELEGAPFSGGAIVSAAEPEHVLGTTDALGAFRVADLSLPAELEVRAEGWTTLVAARFAFATAREEATLVVAPAAPLGLQLVDESGAAVPFAVCALVCDESAWTRLGRPLRLDTALCASFTGDAGGALEIAALARGRGLWLRIEADGFATEQYATLALGREERVVLHPLAPSALVAGTVRHQDGRPAEGTRVRLGQVSTTSDAAGNFLLLPRGVRSDAVLEFSDAEAEPVALRRFGERLADGFEDGLDVTLGADYDPVAGRLLGPQPSGWLVAAFPADESTAEATPSALGTSDGEGRFAFSLPRGEYALYALAADALRVAHLGHFDSRRPQWSSTLPARRPVSFVGGSVRDQDGQPLPGAELEVRVRLDGPAGRRVLSWTPQATDGAGDFGFAAEPELALELALEHPAAAAATFSLRSGSDALQLSLARPACVRVAGFDGGDRCVALDEAGQALRTRGPLHAGAEFALHAGDSPVVDVPCTARWLELFRGGKALTRVPIAPRAGEVLDVRP
ncbi:MAG: RNA polymerase sigma factor [Planctomycetes bacterium]|nr:RNA polymerase sigma factor [Planctomycetota bacterium]